jgi:hypothetical protein
MATLVRRWFGAKGLARDASTRQNYKPIHHPFVMLDDDKSQHFRGGPFNEANLCSKIALLNIYAYSAMAA